MSFPVLPINKPSQAQLLGANYIHVVFNRKMLLWCHLLLGAAAALSYLRTLDIRHINYRPGRGYNSALVIMLRCIPATLPYLIAATFSRRRVTGARAGPRAFSIVLLVGTGAIGLFYMTRYQETAIGTLSTVILQTWVFVLAAVVLLRREE
jgi:hypothetical protein